MVLTLIQLQAKLEGLLTFKIINNLSFTFMNFSIITDLYAFLQPAYKQSYYKSHVVYKSPFG